MIHLPASFLDRPIAHRALHDVTDGRPENSRAAVRAAIERGYGIEIDVQLSANRDAMVFHDYDLARLANAKGPIQQVKTVELSQTTLRHGDEGIPTLPEILDIVAGQVPLLIEIKDQDGVMGPNVGPLETATATALNGYKGDVAVMSFNPHSVAAFSKLVDGIPIGLTTCDYAAEHWPTLPKTRGDNLRDIPDFEPLGCSFISHDHRDLNNPAVARIKDAGFPVCCWTIRSPEEEANARRIADNVTFEQYLA